MTELRSISGCFAQLLSSRPAVGPAPARAPAPGFRWRSPSSSCKGTALHLQCNKPYDRNFATVICYTFELKAVSSEESYAKSSAASLNWGASGHFGSAGCLAHDWTCHWCDAFLVVGLAQSFVLFLRLPLLQLPMNLFSRCISRQVKEQEIQTTDWLEEQKCSNRILLTTASQQPVADPQQARFAAGRLVVNQLCRCAPPPLRELLQDRRPRRSFRPCSARAAGATAPSEKWAADDGARRPSAQNPWDRPSGVVKVSQARDVRQYHLVPAFYTLQMVSFSSKLLENCLVLQ